MSILAKNNADGKPGGPMGGLLGKFTSKITSQAQNYIITASDNLIEDLINEKGVWIKQLENDIKFREHSEEDNIIITRENEKLRIRLQQQISLLNSKRRDPFKQQKISQAIEMIKRTRSSIEQTTEAQKNIREELLVIKASLVIQERIHAELSERMQKHIEDLEEKVSLEQKIQQCKESIERLKVQYEKLLKLMAKLRAGSTEQITITTTLNQICNMMFLMHAYERRTSQLDNDFLHSGIELYKVLEESRKLISRNNLISDKLPYTLSPLKDEYIVSILERWASLDLQVGDEEQTKFSKMSVAYIFRVFIVEVKIHKLIGFLEKQCEDFDQHQNLLRKEQSKMLAIDYEEVKENEIQEAQKINDTIDEKMSHFNKITQEYTVVVQVQRTGVDRFQERIRVQCAAMCKERYRLDDILSKDGYQRVYQCVDTLKDFYYDVERVLKLKWLSHKYDYFINFRRQVMELTSINNDLAANFHILRMTMDKFKRAIIDIENQDINRIDKLIRKMDTFMESTLKDHETLIDIEKKVAELQLQYDELKKIVCEEAEKQVRENIKLRSTDAVNLVKRDNELIDYLGQKKNQYEGLKAEIDQEDIELFNKFQTYEGQIIEVSHDQDTADDQITQIQQRIERLTKQFDNLGPVQMKDIDEVSDIIELLSTIGFHVQVTEHLIEEAFKKIKEFEHAIAEILKYIRNRRMANCDKSLNITFASLDRLIKLIDRYNNDMKNIQDDQHKLINNGFHDQEKDRDTNQFKEQIDQRLLQMKEFGQKRDQLKASLEHYQKEYETKKGGDENSSGMEFQKIQLESEKLKGSIHKEIQKLEGSMADDIQSTKDTNVSLIHKYQQKTEKHQQCTTLRGQKQKDFYDWLEKLSQMQQRQKKLDKALETIKYSPEHQQAFNHFNNRLLNNKDKVNEADRLLQNNSKIINVEAADLDMLPVSIVKTAKLDYIYEMLLKMKFLTDTFNDDITNFDDELKQLEKEIADYLRKLRASQYQDCQDLLNRLDNSLEKLNTKIGEVDGEKVVFEKEFDDVKDKLKNREAIQNAYNGLSNDHSEIKRKRDRFATQISQLKEKFAKIDQDNISVKDCEDIFAEGSQIDHQINDEYDHDVEVQEKLRRLLMKLRNMNANEEERARLVDHIKKLLADNRELLKLMAQNIEVSDSKGHDFERLYNSMIESIDYITRKPNNQKKLPKLAKMREENQRYTKLRNDGVNYCNKYTDEYLEDTYDIDELNDIVAGLQKLNGDLKGYVKILTDLVKALERRRLKTQDAEVRKNANRHMKTHDEVEELQNKCIRTIANIEGALNASNAKDKAALQKKEDAINKVNDFKQQFESFRPKFEKISLEIKELFNEIKGKDLENKESVVKLAEYIDRLAKIGAMLKELKAFIDGLYKQLDDLLASLSSMDLERKLRELIDSLLSAKAQNDEIADHIKRIIKLTDSYDGYTTGAEDKSFFTGMNTKSKKLLEDLKSSSAGMQKSIGDLEKVILVFRADKKTGDPAKDQAMLDRRKGEINVFEQMVNKHLEGQKRILEDSLGNKQKMSDHTLEDKVGRRRNECDEIQKTNDDNLGQIIQTTQIVVEEIAKLQDDKDMVQHIEKLRAQIEDGEKFKPQLEVFRNRITELQVECDQLAEQVEQANSQQEIRMETRLNLFDAHLILKKKIRDFKKEISAFWLLITKWITTITETMGKKPEKVVKPAFKVVPGDDVDKMLAEMLARLGCSVPISRLGGGYYMFGTKKIFCKIINGKLVVRVGGGYMGIEEFILTYMKNETDKQGLAAKIEEQIKAKGNSNFSAASVSNQNKKITKK